MSVRYMLSDAQWEEWKERLLICGIYETENIRMTVEGILWRIRTGAPWRDMPEDFGSWKSIYNQYNRWSKNGIWQKIFDNKIKPRRGQRVEFYGLDD